jgi:hypothetical protein
MLVFVEGEKLENAKEKLQSEGENQLTSSRPASFLNNTYDPPLIKYDCFLSTFHKMPAPKINCA